MPNEAVMPDVLTPVQETDAEPQPGIALCLSGGGFRAMLFHIGSLWRLNELGYLSRLARISSVSGGSITSGMLGLKWSHLGFADGVAKDFEKEVVAPIRAFAHENVDVASIVTGALTPGVTISDKIAKVYSKHLYGDATLQDLPDDPPRFVINATNVQTGALWRFSKPYMRDYQVGEVKSPTIPLAQAVAASSAFPPVLSPARLSLKESQYSPADNEIHHEAPYMTEVYLSDGGVYDNLGLETAWKRCKTILVSDAGGKMAPDPKPGTDWASHGKRVLDLIDNQVRALRKRQVIASFVKSERTGCYWGIRSHVADYHLADPLPCPPDRTVELAEIPTRLKEIKDPFQERLINWGYAICDAGIRRWLEPQAPKPRFPYPAGV
jgi:NTE family protein